MGKLQFNNLCIYHYTPACNTLLHKNIYYTNVYEGRLKCVYPFSVYYKLKFESKKLYTTAFIDKAYILYKLNAVVYTQLKL